MLEAALSAATAAEQRGKVAILQAVDTRTVNHLNARARAERILTGDVARDGGVTLHDGLIAGQGDRIVTRRNNRRLKAPDGGHVRNGALWDITAVLPGGALLARPAGAARLDDVACSGAVVRLPATYVAEHVELGYATTTARSQGVTVDESHTIAGTGMGPAPCGLEAPRPVERPSAIRSPWSPQGCPRPCGRGAVRRSRASASRSRDALGRRAGPPL